jgi:hypothetical protein
MFHLVNFSKREVISVDWLDFWLVLKLSLTVSVALVHLRVLLIVYRREVISVRSHPLLSFEDNPVIFLTLSEYQAHIDALLLALLAIV